MSYFITPTTEEVRNAYIEDEFGIPRESHLIPGFERWLASVKAEAWQEGALWAAVEIGTISHADAAWLTPGDNPYRKETT